MRRKRKERPEFINLANMTTEYVEWFRDSRPEGSTVMENGRSRHVMRSYPHFCELEGGYTKTWAELAGEYWRGIEH